MLVGRQVEERALAELLRAAASGTGSALLITGEPGIGKTALLHRVQEASGLLVLAIVGTESERDIPLAGLASLLLANAPLVEVADARPVAALRDVLAGTEPARPLALGLAVLDLLTSLGDTQPVVVVLDDAHWIDEPTLQALDFARLRLHQQPVSFLAATRPGTPPLLEGADVLRLEGLDRVSARAVLSTTGTVTDEVAGRCRRLCGGNPLALLELGRSLTDDQRRGAEPLPPILPVADRLERWLAARLEALPAPTRVAVGVLALAGTVGPGVLASALRELDLDWPDLDPALVDGVLRSGDDGLHLAHPLYGTVAVAALSPQHRRAIHRSLADLLPDAALERRAWHLAEGQEGDPADALRALAQVAARASDQGAHLVAAQAWERAARLAPSPDEQAEHLVAAGRAAWDAGRPDLAGPLLRRARAAVPPGPTRAQATDVLGQVLGWTESAEVARHLLDTEVDHVRLAHPDLAVGLLVSSARMASLAASPDAVAIATDAEEVAERAGDLARVAARTMATHVRLMRGEPADTLADRLRDLDALGALVADGVGRPLLELAQLLGFDLMVRERWTEASGLFEQVTAVARRAALTGVENFSCAMGAEVAWRTGRWSIARGEALVAVRFHRSVHGLGGTFGDATLARTAAAIGLVDDAVAHARLAADRGDHLGLASLSAWGRHALGLAALADGRVGDAVEPLRWIWDLERSGDVTDPGVLWWHGDLLEALLASGATADADRLVAQLDEAARSTGRVWAAAIAARGRGLLEREPAALARSAELLDHLDAPFEAARSRLALASCQDGEDRLATLTRARDAFEALGARPWAQRTRDQLGTPDDAAPPSIAAVLTPAELRVALTVGRGLTNRESADALALSPRTVDAHLQSIYRKLGIRTRTQLAVTMGDAGR